MIKKVLSIVFSIVLVFGLSVCACAEEQRFVFDDAGVLTYHEIAEFEGRANILYQTWGCEVYIITYESLMEYEAWELNELLYAELKEYYGAGEDVVMLTLAMEERQYDILAHGYGNTAFTDYGKDVMAERFLDDFAIDDWYWGFNDYLNTCDEFLEMAANGEPFDVSSDEGGSNILGVIIIVLISCLVAFGVCLVFKAQMKTARIATEAHDYQKELDLTNQYDRFSHRDIRRVYNPPQDNDNNSGGGTTINAGGFSHKSGGF